MLPQEILEMRLQQLKENVAETLKLINDFEVELRDEDDPGRKSKYRRRIENLNQQKVNYEKKFEEIVTQLTDKQTTEVKIIANDLEEIKNKLDTLQENQATLHQMLLSHFTEEEQALVQPLTEQLNQTELIEMQAVLEAVDTTNQVSESDIQKILDDIQNMLTLMNTTTINHPLLLQEKEEFLKIINEPKIDAKHSLKVSLPIIPGLISYESEFGLGSEISPKNIWKNIKSKFWNN